MVDRLSDAVAPSLTLLAVDDDLEFLLSIREGMAEETTTVLVAQSAESALWLLRESQVDVLLCGLGAAERDGHRLLDTVREQWPGIARILISPPVNGATARHLFPTAQAVLQKPVDLASLRSLLEYLPGR
jgi:DNA-binding NtrC family response regulator